MDEFEWERFMKESDKRTEKYGELLEKYHGASRLAIKSWRVKWDGRSWPTT